MCVRFCLFVQLLTGGLFPKGLANIAQTHYVWATLNVGFVVPVVVVVVVVVIGFGLEDRRQERVHKYIDIWMCIDVCIDAYLADPHTSFIIKLQSQTFILLGLARNNANKRHSWEQAKIYLANLFNIASTLILINFLNELHFPALVAQWCQRILHRLKCDMLHILYIHMYVWIYL